MDDAPAVRLIEGFCHLPRQVEHDRHGQRTPGESLGQRLALDQLHDDKEVIAILGDVVRHRDGWRTQDRGGSGFLQQTSPPVGIPAVLRGDELQRHVPAEPGVTGAIDLAHAAGTKLVADFVVQPSAS